MDNTSTSIFSSLLQIRPRQALNVVKAAVDAIADLPYWEEHRDAMTYEEALGYFISERFCDPTVAKGAMLVGRENSDGEIEFSQVFLTKENAPVKRPDGSFYGRRMWVGHIDSPLANVFGSRRLVVVT